MCAIAANHCEVEAHAEAGCRDGQIEKPIQLSDGVLATPEEDRSKGVAGRREGEPARGRRELLDLNRTGAQCVRA